MRTFLIAVIASVGAALMGGLLGWGVWVVQGRPGAVAPSLAVMQPLPGRPGAPEPASRRAFHALPSNPRRGDGRGQLALVIDDIGHSMAQVEDFLALGVPLTFSILPDLAHTRGAARRIHQAQRDYLIHIPMEPEGFPHTDPGPSPLLLAQGAEETQRRIRSYLADMPHAVGASNHMGSAYTADPGHMAVVLGELASHRLFFLNSKTAPSAVPGRLAAQHSYGYLSRDFFLDNERDVGAITRQIGKAAHRARERGFAIAIGHPYGETLQALQGAMARGELEDVELVRLSELAR